MQPPQKGPMLIASAILLLIIVIMLFLIPGSQAEPGPPRAYLMYASAGAVPQLLNTGQVDSYIIWEPVVANAQLAGTGRMIATPADLPPPYQWANDASCVLVLRNDFIAQHPDLAAMISALTTAGINRTNEDPELAEQITAAWVYGTKPILTPTGSLDPLDVENSSFANMEFVDDAPLPVSIIVANTVEDAGMGTYNPQSMMNQTVKDQGDQLLAGAPIPQVSGEVPEIGLGYLPSSDNFAPLYVMVKDSGYFCQNYGFCLVPDNPQLSRPTSCTLMVNGSTAAYVNLVQGQSGGGLMTAVGQEVLAGTYVGSIPAEQQIALGNPSSIIQSINTGGTGLVVGPQNPVRDWDDFVRWVKLRSASGRPVIIATVQSSIQEDMIRQALGYENISVILYGTDYQTPYP